jgi:hypothetical protein
MSNTLNIWKRKPSSTPTAPAAPAQVSPAPVPPPVKDRGPELPASAAKPPANEGKEKPDEGKKIRVPFPSRGMRRLSEEQVRTINLTVNVSQEERDYFWEYCRVHDIAFGAWARTVLLSAVRRAPPKNLRAANGSSRHSRSARGRSQKGEK